MGYETTMNFALDLMEWFSANYSIWDLVFPLVTWRFQVVRRIAWDNISIHHCIDEVSMIVLLP